MCLRRRASEHPTCPEPSVIDTCSVCVSWQVAPQYKLPIFYLTDSILKNVRGPYPSLFGRVIVPLYCNCVKQVRRHSPVAPAPRTWSHTLVL